MLIPYAATAASLITYSDAPSDPYIGLDGFLNVPAVSAGRQHPLLFLNYATRPPWRVAGADYPVGPMDFWSSQYSDPTTNTPPGCVMTGNTLVVQEDSVIIEGYDFSINGGINIFCPGNNLTIANCLFSGPNYKTLNTGIVDFRGYNLTMKYCDVDGGYDRAGTLQPYLPSLVYLAGRNGQISVNYVRFRGAPNFILRMGSCASLIFQFNLIEDMHPGDGARTSYVAWFADGNSCDNIRWQFNTSIQASTIPIAGEGVQFYDRSGRAAFTDVSCQYNTMLAPGASPAVSMSFLMHGANIGYAYGELFFGYNYVDITGAAGAYSAHTWRAAGFTPTGPTIDLSTDTSIPYVF